MAKAKRAKAAPPEPKNEVLVVLGEHSQVSKVMMNGHDITKLLRGISITSDLDVNNGFTTVVLKIGRGKRVGLAAVVHGDFPASQVTIE